ncbi:MAG TPA: hypothetical protein VE110_07725 [Gemmatimonadaceae bacterium]|jgi:hypothetical protein|nr:hypothetical protein [Gemmatimonadaceae bacterium]
MTTRKITLGRFDDIEKPHPVVTDTLGEGLSCEPLTVRLGELWSDFLRAADETEDAARKRSSSAVPILDDMKGILQWD